MHTHTHIWVCSARLLLHMAEQWCWYVSFKTSAHLLILTRKYTIDSTFPAITVTSHSLQLMLLCSTSQGRGLPKISGGWCESLSPHPTALSHSHDRITKQKFNPSITLWWSVFTHVHGSIATAPRWAHILSPWLIPWSSEWRVDMWKDSLHSGVFC